MSYIIWNRIRYGGILSKGIRLMKGYGTAAFFASVLLMSVSLGSVAPAWEIKPELIRTAASGILLNFKNTPLDTVLEYLSEVAGLVVVSDNELKDRITVISRKPLSLDETITLINTVLKEKGFAAIRMGRTLKIVSFSDAKKMNIPVRSGNNPNDITPSDELVTHIIPVNYTSAIKLKDNLSMLISKDADLTANGDTNVLIITDTTANIRRLVEIVNALDTHMAAVAEIKVFHLEYSDATSTAKLINEIFEEHNQAASGPDRVQSIFETMRQLGKRGPPGSPPSSSSESGNARITAKVTATADERTNSVVVSAPHDSMDVIGDLIVDLDSNPAEGQSVFVYPLKNARAENLEEILKNLFSELEGTSLQNQGAAVQRQQNQQPAQRQQRPSPFAERGGGFALGQPGTQQSSSGSDGSSSFDDLAGQVSIEADEDTNSLIVMTSPKNYEKVKKILEELDKPVPQVLIKVLLAEVTHGGSVELGMEFSYLNMWAADGSISLVTDLGIGGLTSGYVANVLEEKFDLRLRALEQDGKLNILSRPYILASNNQTAKITVGNEVPFIRDTRVTETGQTINTIEYEDIGIILEVTPYINPAGLVIMDVSQEISAITGNSVPISATVNASVYAKRSSENRIIARDGQTVVIGGLIEDRDTDVESKVPLFGDIPLLGLLFRSVERTKVKTELLIFLTPYVASTDEELKTITEREKEKSEMIKETFEQDVMDEDIEAAQEEIPVSE